LNSVKTFKKSAPNPKFTSKFRDVAHAEIRALIEIRCQAPHSCCMQKNLTLPDWNSLAHADDEHLPLLSTALLIARDEYPQLAHQDYLQQIDDYAEKLRPVFSKNLDLPSQLTAINQFLFEECGYSGNHHDYDDPRNSYLNQVLDRKLGIPISLAVIQIELTRRMGLPLDGISFPGHFLVRMPVDDGILVLDPFNGGRPISADELKERAQPYFDGEHPNDDQLIQMLAPATHRMILMRMLRNLKTIYTQREDWERVARSCDRLLKLAAHAPDALRDRGLAYQQLGYVKGASEDLSRYLQLMPEAEDANSIRSTLIELGSTIKRLH
jgi:regulator of sirC expression with transglutaminase-like and TPR domain